MIANGDLKNWWEGVLYEFIDEGIDIYCKDVGNAFWSEVDHIGDYRRLMNWVSAKNKVIRKVSTIPQLHLDTQTLPIKQNVAAL